MANESIINLNRWLQLESEGLNIDEFFDMYRNTKPNATREEFEKHWAQFIHARMEYKKSKSIQ